MQVDLLRISGFRFHAKFYKRKEETHKYIKFETIENAKINERISTYSRDKKKLGRQEESTAFEKLQLCSRLKKVQRPNRHDEESSACFSLIAINSCSDLDTNEILASGIIIKKFMRWILDHLRFSRVLFERLTIRPWLTASKTQECNIKLQLPLGSARSSDRPLKLKFLQLHMFNSF